MIVKAEQQLDAPPALENTWLGHRPE